MINWAFSIHLLGSLLFINTPATYLFRPGSRLRWRLLCLLAFLSVAAAAQKNTVKDADNLVNEKKYKEAVTIYKLAYDADKKKDRALLLKLADANYLNENYTQSQNYYAQYFSDSVYQDIPQFVNYAKSAKANGNIKLATRLYYKIYENKQDAEAKSIYDIFKLYLDTIQKIKTYNLDSNYSCILLDASESVDNLASPMIYIWTFEDSTTTEGISFEHCFKEGGLHKIVLSIRDQQTGLLRTNDTTLTIYTESPPVKFTSPRNGHRYLPVDFDASATVFYNYEIVDYIWDLDNGDMAMGKKIKYRYPNFGTYTVRLTVVAKDKSSGKYELFSSVKIIEVNENFNNSKTFTEQRNDAK